MRTLRLGALLACLTGCECALPDPTGMGGGEGGGGPTGQVALIELREVSLLQVGQTGRLSAVAVDANGLVLAGVTFAYQSSDPTVATVEAGTVTALKEGFALVTASAMGITSNQAVVTVFAELPDRGTTDALLEAATDAGLIDSEKALLYRVYAAFGDDRLPFEYQSVHPPPDDALDQAAARWPDLSEATRDTLEPFFAPPAYLGSWASPGKKPRSLLGICQLPVIDPNWGFTPLSGGRVKVWYDSRRADGLTVATRVATEIETVIWDKLFGPGGFGMLPPLSDATVDGCNGGDGRLDVFLAPLAADGLSTTNLGQTQPNEASRKHAAPHVMLNPDHPIEIVLASAAHELMHASQWSYDVSAFTLSSYTWLKEATAQEAIDFVYPKVDLEQFDIYKSRLPRRAYLDSPANSIEEGSVDRAYAGYLLFQYLVKTGSPSVIGAIWSKTPGTTEQLKAVDLSVPGGLKEQWPKFARTVWNDAPVKDEPASFAKWDTMFEKPLYASADGDLMGAPKQRAELSNSAEHGSFRYARFELDEVASRALLFHNTWYLPGATDNPIHVEALWLDSAGVWHDEDWSKLEFIGFCRDKKAERVDDLVIIVSNSATNGGPRSAAVAPSLTVTNLPCWGIEGTMSRERVDSQWSSGASRVSVTARFENAIALSDPTQGLSRVPFTGPLFKSGVATLDEQYSIGSCSYAMNGTFPVSSVTEGGDVGGTIVMNYFHEPAALTVQQEPVLGPHERAYSVQASSSKVLMGMKTGPSPCPGPYATGLADLLLTSTSVAQVKYVKADGTMADRFVSGDAVFTWTLRPLREP